MYTASDEEQISSHFIKQLTLALQKDRQERKDGTLNCSGKSAFYDCSSGTLNLSYENFNGSIQNDYKAKDPQGNDAEVFYFTLLLFSFVAYHFVNTLFKELLAIFSGQ